MVIGSHICSSKNYFAPIFQAHVCFRRAERQCYPQIQLKQLKAKQIPFLFSLSLLKKKKKKDRERSMAVNIIYGAPNKNALGK